MVEKTVKASKPMARVSLKDSVVLFRHIKNKPTSKAKNLLQGMIERKKNINGKYYTKTSKEILDLIKDCEANAESLGLIPERLFIKKGQANKTFTFMLPKSRWTHRGRRAKICHLEIELEER